MTYITQTANRRRHIASAIRYLGGNRSAAATLSRNSGAPLHENRVADWKRVGSVPQAWCLHLVVATDGRFQPARVRPKWAEEMPDHMLTPAVRKLLAAAGAAA